MSQTQYKKLPIWSTLKQIISHLENESFTELNFLKNEVAILAKNRIFDIVNYILKYEEMSYSLVSENKLNSFNSYFTHVLQEITNFISNKSLHHIINANTYLDQTVLNDIFPNLSNFDEKESVNQSIINIKDSYSKAIKYIEGEHKKLKAKYDDLNTEYENQKEKLNSLANITEQQQNEGIIINANNEASYLGKESERKIKFEELLSEFSIKYEDKEKNLNLRAEKIIQELESDKNQAAKILQIVGNIGITGNYQKIAETEYKQANIWRMIASGIFSIGIFIAIFIFYHNLQYSNLSSNELWLTAVRLLFAIVITTPAWYAAKESNKHRDRADKAKQTELELASLEPFIEFLPDEKKHAIKEELIEKYFGNNKEC